MAIVTSIRRRGQRSVSTLNGSVSLEEGRGRLVIYDNGGNERTVVDILGLTTIRTNGEYANRVGQAGDDGRDGIWTANSDEDLKDLLGG